MEFERFFTKNGDEHDSIWEKRDVKIYGKDGLVFEQNDVEVPKFWSDTAISIVASKYFKTINGVPENSVKQLVGRVVDKIVEWGNKDKYFTTKEDAQIFNDELTHILTHQYAAFNTPVWLNLGVPNRPQTGSACFLLDVEDNLESISDWYGIEWNIFKAGAGSGCNVSKLRPKNAPLSGGGYGSGPVSFMKAADCQAGVIKSGGAARRSAKMTVMDISHPDIKEFITCKTKEEAKAKALIAAGYDSSFEGEAYNTVAFQNTNHTIRINDQFMSKYLANDSDTVDLMNLIASEAWQTGDPGIQYQENIDKYYTVPNCGPQITSNVCQPDFATVLTPNGITTFKYVNIGDTIWSGKRWTRVTNKVNNDVKPVYKYETTAGYFLGTEDHRVVSKGIKVPVKDADFLDSNVGPDTGNEELNLQDVMDGWVLGDGTVHKASNNLVYLLIGQDDGDIFKYLPDYILKSREKSFSGLGWEIKTTIVHNELPKTYNRVIPDRFRFSNSTQVRGFLRGLFSANGTVTGGRVSLRASSFEVIAAAQEMLSSLGIASYYTTNKDNLNITKHKDKFKQLIGFVQDYKNEKLDKLLKYPTNNGKDSYEIKVIEFIGEYTVYDITVDDPDHTYWTGGVLVSNCSEIFQNCWSACTLCCINLLKFNTRNDFDLISFQRAINIITAALDIIVSNSDYPDQRIAENSKNQRHIGIGYCNLGALLMTRGIAYDSHTGRDLIARITSNMTAYSYLQSANIATELGSFTDYEKNSATMLKVISEHKNSALLQWGKNSEEYKLWELVYQSGKHSGYRNAHVTALMPSGTVAFMMGADTTGIEPAPALVIYKNMVGGGIFKITNPLVANAMQSLNYASSDIDYTVKYLEEHGTLVGNIKGIGLQESDLPVFATAFGDSPLSSMAHINMVAAAQPFVSQGISKTCNLPNDATVDDIKNIFVEAWKLGLKSVTVYRDRCKATQPLNTSKKVLTTDIMISKPTRTPLPDTRDAINHKFSLAGHEIYITVGLYENGQPGELFIRSNKFGSLVSGLLDSIGVVTSYALQHGVPLETLTNKLKYTAFGDGGFTGNSDIPQASSIIDYIAKWLEFSFINKPFTVESPVIKSGNMCKNCGAQLVRTGTCETCINCGQPSGGCS